MGKINTKLNQNKNIVFSNGYIYQKSRVVERRVFKPPPIRHPPLLICCCWLQCTWFSCLCDGTFQIQFYNQKHILNFTFSIDKNNAYTLIRVCWIRFLNQFWHYSARDVSKLALKLWKSKKFTFSIFDEQSNWVSI